jgi:hypothetical protein
MQGFVQGTERQQTTLFAAGGAILVSRDGEIAFPTRTFRADVHNVLGGAIAFTEMPDIAALIAFLLKPTLLAAVNSAIDASANDRASLSVADRQKRTSTTQSELLRVERDEAALIWRAQREGMAIEHRADCSALAVLQCEIITAPARASDGTSVEHGWDVIQPGDRR